MEVFDFYFYDVVLYFGSILFSFMMGAMVMLVLLSYLFHKYLQFSALTLTTASPAFKVVELCDNLQDNLGFQSSESNQSVETCRFLNVLLSFIFKEWRDTDPVHRWLLKKIDVELMELMETKAASKLLHSIKVHDINLGSSVPVIKGVTIKEPCSFHNGAVPTTVIIDIDVEYSGGFFLAVDVDLVFGTSAFLSFCVKHLSGHIRLHLSRNPCTHWSVSFIEKPNLKLSVDTSFQSRPLPQLGSLVLNQFYKTVKRKHTFPNYKLRYTPIFAFHCTEDAVSPQAEDVTTNLSKIDVIIVSCTRLLLPYYEKEKQGSPHLSKVIFATLSLDEEACESRGSIKIKEPVNKPSFVLSPSTTLTPTKLKTSADGPDKILDSNDVGMEKLLKKFPKIMKAEILESKPEMLESKPETSADTSCPSNNPPSYMMVTRNFSALLYEKTNAQSDGTKQVTVHVGSITGIRSSNEKTGIIEGDVILSINGDKIKSLGQAITVIKSVRMKKNKFQFKVQRNPSSQLSTPPEFSVNATSSVNQQKQSSEELQQPQASKEELYPLQAAKDSPRSRVIKEHQQPLMEKELIPRLYDSDSSDTESDFSDVDDLIEENRNDLSLTQRMSIRNIARGMERLIDKEGTSTVGDDLRESNLPNETDLSFAKITINSISHILKTSLCDADQAQYSWKNETHSFTFKPGQKYLNIRFWYQEIPTTALQKMGNRLLVGNLAVSLFHLCKECEALTSKTRTRRYKVNSPWNTTKDIKWNLSESFTQRTNFRKDYCYGDATIITQLKQ